MALKLEGLTDAGAYLSNKMFRGIYKGEKVHDPDVKRVLSRAFDNGLQRIIVVGTSYKKSVQGLKISHGDKRVHCTIGCKPSKLKMFKKMQEEYARELGVLAENKKCVAVGECGLDYTILKQDEDKKMQQKYFDWQIQLAVHLEKPLMLFYRKSFEDLMTSLAKFEGRLFGGVVHAFDGTVPEAQELIRKGFFIGINGCSVKTPEGCAVAREIPLNRLVLGSSSPFCYTTKPHAAARHIVSRFPGWKKNECDMGMVYGRTEPSHIVSYENEYRDIIEQTEDFFSTVDWFAFFLEENVPTFIGFECLISPQKQLTEMVSGVRKMQPQVLADIVRYNLERVFFTKHKMKIKLP